MSGHASSVKDYLRRHSESAFVALWDQVKELSDAQSWWRPEVRNEVDYVHTTGSILGIILHVASCKEMYREYAFGAARLSWQDMIEVARKHEPQVEACRGWLKEAHERWIDSWKDLADADLSAPRKTNWGEEKPTEWIISAMMGHNPDLTYQPETELWVRWRDMVERTRTM